jgi:ATP synthase protein I
MISLVFAFGAVSLGVVARVAPAASLLVALLTYTLQVVLVGLVYIGLSGSGSLDGPIDPRWLSAAVIACTLTWITTQIVVSTRARQPIYELASQGAEASVR